MQRPSNDLIVVIVIAVLSGVVSLLAPAISIVRLVCALPLVLFLPGYAITAACFPQRPLDAVERLLFSLGISLAVTALIGLVLQWTHLSLQASTWAIVLSMTVVAASAIAWLRRKQYAAAEASPASMHSRPSFREGLLLGLAILVTGTAVGIARLPTPPSSVSGYTLLWMVPAGDGNVNDFRLGVSSQEFEATTYRLQVSVDGRLIGEWPELKLAPGDSWESLIGLPSDRAGAGSVEAVLYRSDDPGTVYRRVELRLGE